jgi:transglutaminase/protease-like cytokinesis protein 3
MNASTIFYRLFFSLSFLVASSCIYAQETDTIAEKAEPAAVNTNAENFTDSASTAKFKKVDTYVLALKKRSKVTVLAKEITAPFTTDEEKVRALFIWMTNNIAFDCVTYHNKKTPEGNLSYKSPAELLVKLDKYYYNYSMLVLRNRKAVAEGYAILFRELCKNAGINCQLVEGKASENKDKIKKYRTKKNFNTNHTWNKVEVNGVWYYIDVTWASGYCDKPVNKFFKKFNPYYFLVPIDKLYPTHAENSKFTERRNNPTGE